MLRNWIFIPNAIVGFSYSFFMKTTPLVSVVLCTYNDEKYISDTIRSVLSQSYDNFEFIIWNDGSTDNSEKIINSFNDSRIRYYYHKNTGIGVASKLACEKASGKYIARIDGDDLCLPDRFKTQVDFLEKNRSYVVVSSAVLYIDEDGETIGRSFPITEDWAIRRMLKIADPIANPASMFLREAYMKTGGYIGIRQREDYFLFCRISKYGKIKILSTPLIKYRLRKNSLSYYSECTDYDNVLCQYRNKMINDQTVKDRDVELYNYIFEESKKESSMTNKERNIKALHNSGFIYRFINSRIGGGNFICLLKNFYCYLKYR